MPVAPVQTSPVATVATGAVAPVAVVRNPFVGPVLKLLEKDAKDGVAARQFMFADNAKMDSWLYSYHTGKVKEANLVTAPPNNKLVVTIAMHVSGHTNQADQFATNPNERWTINVNGPTGSQSIQVAVGGKPGAPVYSFAQDVTIDVSKPGNYTVDAYPNGSGGVGGYPEGRRYNLHVGQQNFFKPVLPPANYVAGPNETDPYPDDEADSLAYDIQHPS